MTVFDTARAYGDNERLLARALRRCGAERRARIVTKGGMARPEGRWVPDGRAKSILADCDASLAALDGLEIDLYLIHAPDPRTPWRTTLRALARLAERRSRQAYRRVERQPRSARRGARPCSGRGGPGLAQPVRRPCDSRRCRRTLCRARRCGDCALSAGRTASGESACSSRGLRRCRGGAWGDSRRSRPRVAPRALAGGCCNPRGSAPGDGTVGDACSDARAHGERTGRARFCARATSPDSQCVE